MALCPVFTEFARDVLARGAAEIGMHLHAWDSPPIVPLTHDDLAHHPYLCEFPEAIVRQKVAYLTELLESRFERKMVSHRAGRWWIDETYARVLVDHGYRVDCSVTPLLSWQSCMGDPNGVGGPDYTSFPVAPYFVDLDDVSRPGDSSLLEVPLTVRGPRSRLLQSLQARMRHCRGPFRGAFFRLFPATMKLVADGHNLRQLLRIVTRAAAEQLSYLQFTIHSSELMPGGSERFRDAAQIELLYEHLEALFTAATTRSYRGATLQEYCMQYSLQRAIADVPQSSTLPDAALSTP
jgi:hypothetical protein